MEYVSRLPNEIFGTIHGPGYNGGGSFGGIYDFGERVDNELPHVHRRVGAEPDHLVRRRHPVPPGRARPTCPARGCSTSRSSCCSTSPSAATSAAPSIRPTPTRRSTWSTTSGSTRVPTPPSGSRRRSSTAVAGWQQVSIPMTDFVRSADQPAGAPERRAQPERGLGLRLRPALPGRRATYQFDLVRRTPFPPPTELIVTNLDDSGPGSLREALALIADGGTITFDPGSRRRNARADVRSAHHRQRGNGRRVGRSAGDDQRVAEAPRVIQVGAGVGRRHERRRHPRRRCRAAGWRHPQPRRAEPRPRGRDRQHREQCRTGHLRPWRRRHLQRRRRRR